MLNFHRNSTALPYRASTSTRREVLNVQRTVSPNSLLLRSGALQQPNTESPTLLLQYEYVLHTSATWQAADEPLTRIRPRQRLSWPVH